MRKIITLGGIIMLMYIKNYMTMMSLTTDPNNIFSDHIYNLLILMPQKCYIIGYYLCLIICIISLFTKNSIFIKLFSYGIAVTALSLGIQLAIDLFSYRDYTSFAFLQIYHPIPLEAKQQFLFNQIDLLLTKTYPNIYEDAVTLQYCTERITIALKVTDWEIIRKLSPAELRNYAHYIVTDIYYPQHDFLSFAKKYYHYLLFLPIMPGIIKYLLGDVQVFDLS